MGEKQAGVNVRASERLRSLQHQMPLKSEQECRRSRGPGRNLQRTATSHHLPGLHRLATAPTSLGRFTPCSKGTAQALGLECRQ